MYVGAWESFHIWSNQVNQGPVLNRAHFEASYVTPGMSPEVCVQSGVFVRSLYSNIHNLFGFSCKHDGQEKIVGF